MRVEDCEAYKAFLVVPGECFPGPPVARASRKWRPFALGGLSPESPRYVVRVIRAALMWRGGAVSRRQSLAGLSNPNVVARVRCC
ncbi:hypothetical protein [Burkholderia cenocepacia]|uniref:hypothetical protein n=1 Tax=Burkholderia cenocepacia TaxID=95486 RepID=UPI0021AB2EE7|nr:hypothetical protein [Burkholderia cenocepacia]